MFFSVGAAGVDGDIVSNRNRNFAGHVKEVGWRPLVQGVLLWILVGVTSLYLFVPDGSRCSRIFDDMHRRNCESMVR